MYYLQNRFLLKEDKKIYYYGLRSGKNLFKNKISLSSKQYKIISSLPKDLSDKEKIALKSLIGSVVVEEKYLRKTPTSLFSATFCKTCASNDFIIPGLEFDQNGICPICKSKDEVKDLVSVVPLISDIPKSKKSRFDVAVFYTGGKDSTYLLYYLSVVKNLRVLALTWEIPFMSRSARESIQNAKKKLTKVEFLSRYVKEEDLKVIYKELFALSGNTCACPSLAYMLFYPDLVDEKVPYFLVGNEPAQILGLYYNHFAPKIAYKFADNKFLNFMINVGRVLTLRPPLKRGQFQTLATMKQLAYGDSPIKKWSGYNNDLVTNVVKAIHKVPNITKPLKRAIKRSSFTGNIPAFVHIDFDRAMGGVYNWKEVKDLIVKECGFVPPKDDGKGLHTSCEIEKCKEYTQFLRFYHCKSQMIPFSALEISIASQKQNLTREQAIYEMQNLLGFSLEKIPEYDIMCSYLKE